MIDCYRVLGVSPHASQDEIRAAYIARMKVLHPDARRAPDAEEASASDVSSAYWQLRTRERRSEHDRQLFASASLPAASRARAAPKNGPVPASPRQPRRSPGRERASAVLMGAAMGIVVLALAAPAGLFWMAHLYPIESARAKAAPVAASAAVPPRRPLDAEMRAAAADDFAAVLKDFGLAGAHTFSRRCLSELSARASMTMLDYCIAFDDAAANWERPQTARIKETGKSKEAGKSKGRRFFADDQRFAQYREIAKNLQEPEVRRAMLMEAGFFGRATRAGAGQAGSAKLSAL